MPSYTEEDTSTAVNMYNPSIRVTHRRPHYEAAHQPVSKLNLDSQGSFIIEIPNFFPFL